MRLREFVCVCVCVCVLEMIASVLGGGGKSIFETRTRTPIRRGLLLRVEPLCFLGKEKHDTREKIEHRADKTFERGLRSKVGRSERRRDEEKIMGAWISSSSSLRRFFSASPLSLRVCLVSMLAALGQGSLGRREWKEYTAVSPKG